MASAERTNAAMQPALEHSKMACLLLAAGAATRFGGGKLTYMLDGAYLGLHAARTLASIGFGHLVAVCNPADQALCDAYAELGFELVANDHPESGQSQSLRLGIAALALRKTKGVMVALADMPFITVNHCNALLAAFEKADELLAVTSFNGTTNLPPSIFPASSFAALSTITGDQGARYFLNNVAQVIGDVDMLRDIDRPEDLAFRS
jgi:molybdenum cofactor cytidylyltransferase